MSFEKFSFEKQPEKESKKNTLEAFLTIIKPETNTDLEKYPTINTEKYHTQQSETLRHLIYSRPEPTGKYSKEMFEVLELEWELHEIALENYDPSTGEIGPSAITPDEVMKFSFEQLAKREKPFLESLANSEEQKTRKEIRETLIKQLELIYDNLDKNLFVDKNKEKREYSLANTLEKLGIVGKDQGVLNILTNLHRPWGYKKQIIEDKEKFIENALLRFDPLIFEEAQIKVLGNVREKYNYRKAHEEKLEELRKRETEIAQETLRREREKHDEEFKERLKKYREGRK